MRWCPGLKSNLNHFKQVLFLRILDSMKSKNWQKKCQRIHSLVCGSDYGWMAIWYALSLFLFWVAEKWKYITAETEYSKIWHTECGFREIQLLILTMWLSYTVSGSSLYQDLGWREEISLCFSTYLLWQCPKSIEDWTHPPGEIVTMIGVIAWKMAQPQSVQF